jgi:hypothetical protein
MEELLAEKNNTIRPLPKVAELNPFWPNEILEFG